MGTCTCSTHEHLLNHWLRTHVWCEGESEDVPRLKVRVLHGKHSLEKEGEKSMLHRVLLLRQCIGKIQNSYSWLLSEQPSHT